MTADTSSSEAAAQNGPRQKIIAVTVYDFPFPVAQIQPIISTIQPNVPTILGGNCKLKNDVVKQLKSQNLAFEKTKADLVYAQENTIKKIFQQMGYTRSC